MTEHQKSPGRGSPPPMPQWVKISVIIFILFILLVIALHIMGFDFGHHGMSGMEIFLSMTAKELRV